MYRRKKRERMKAKFDRIKENYRNKEASNQDIEIEKRASNSAMMPCTCKNKK